MHPVNMIQISKSWNIPFNRDDPTIELITIISGKIFYTVKSWELRTTKDGNKVVFLTAYNHTLNREMSIVASTPDGKFFMAVYDYTNLLSYYFSEWY